MPKVLLFDLETSPILGYTFGLYETNVLHVVRDSFMLSFAFKWQGDKKVQVRALPDYPLYKKDRYDDTSLLKDLHALIDSADIVIAHNGDGFDVKVANARFIKQGLDPIANRISIDTLKEARKKFRFTSNKLTDLATYAGLGQKKETGGKDLWVNCMDGDPKAWRKMKEYNIHDVVLLEGIYLWMRPWMKTHPNMNIFKNTIAQCSRCLSSNVMKWGRRFKGGGAYQRFMCGECGCEMLGTQNLIDNKPILK